MDITALPASPPSGTAAPATPSPSPANSGGAGGFARSLEQAASRQAQGSDARPPRSTGAEAPGVPAVAERAPSLSLAQLVTASGNREEATARTDELPAEAPADLAAMLLQVPLPPTPPTTGSATPGRAETDVPDELQHIRTCLQAIESAGQPAEAALADQTAQVVASRLPASASSSAVSAFTAAPVSAGQPPFQANTAAAEWSGPVLSTAEGAGTGEGLPPGMETMPGNGAAFTPATISQPAGGLSAAGTPASASLAAPLASPDWQRGLSQHLIGLQQRGEQEIELHLHPAELGPLSISLKLGEAGAQAQFLSAHPQVRAAVEQAIPQLREALAEQGITLGETSVGERQHQPQGERSGDSGGSGALAGGAGEEAAPGQVEAATPRPVRLEGVDLYA
ncbi:flagellar hook-length control protein FliK [Azotobacter salinestris]|uniref:flagellar hook-length control protein FliK n=1 Tax=Azotobacter salinestris TaxID=69964 RepID=UPI0032DEBD20